MQRPQTCRHQWPPVEANFHTHTRTHTHGPFCGSKMNQCRCSSVFVGAGAFTSQSRRRCSLSLPRLALSYPTTVIVQSVHVLSESALGRWTAKRTLRFTLPLITRRPAYGTHRSFSRGASKGRFSKKKTQKSMSRRAVLRAKNGLA